MGGDGGTSFGACSWPSVLDGKVARREDSRDEDDSKTLARPIEDGGVRWRGASMKFVETASGLSFVFLCVCLCTYGFVVFLSTRRHNNDDRKRIR